MFKVELSDGLYSVRFMHYLENPANAKRRRNVTLCRIVNETHSLLNAVSIGEAICNPVDSFKKAVGRKVALAKALSSFDKDMRKAFWSAYFSNYKQ